jgi:hypothetical protein
VRDTHEKNIASDNNREIRSRDSMYAKHQPSESQEDNQRNGRVVSQTKIFKGKMTKMRDHINLLKFKTAQGGSQANKY